MLGRKILIGSLQVAGGHGAKQLLSFLRNLLIARLVGPENFGLGLTFVLLITLLEMAAELSCDKFLIQDARGDDESVQSTLHLFMVARGILFAVGLFFAADLIASALAMPSGIAWAYQVLALAPLCAAFVHLDLKRYHRRLHYTPDVTAEVSGNAASLVVGIALAFMLGDYRAMLYAVVARFATTAAVSHLLAERRYRIGLTREVAGRAWRFSWPLMINGLVLFAASQGDRALVVRFLGGEALGVYAAAALVVHALGAVAVTVVTNIGLPVLSSRKEMPGVYAETYARVGAVVSLAVVGLATASFLVLPHLIPLLFGSDYGIPGGLIALLVAALAIRIFRSWGVVGALALGTSRLVMTANILRMTGVGVAALALAMGGDIVHVAGAIVAGEVIATVAVFLQMRACHGLSLNEAARFFGIVASVTAACLFVEWTGAGADFASSLGFHAAILATGVATSYLVSAEVRELTKDAWTLLRREAAWLQTVGARARHQGFTPPNSGKHGFK